MQQYQDSVTHDNGTPVAGASIRVLTAAGAQATIYSDNGVTVAANPIKAGANGQFSFYAADGNYSLVISATSHVTRTVSGIALDSSGSSANIPAAAALDGTESANIKQSGSIAQTTIAKIAQWISANVRGLGAKGDGTTDDTAAIVSAQTAGDAYLPAGSFSVGAAAPDYDVHGPGRITSGGIQSGGAVLSYNPARESIFFAPSTYQREFQGQTYPTRYGPGLDGSSYNTIFSQGSKLKDYTKHIQNVCAYGNWVGSAPLEWQYIDAFGGDTMAYAGNVHRVTALGSEALAWYGAPDANWVITYKHDFWRKPSNNPYLPGEAGWNLNGLETLFPGIGARIAAFTGYSTDPEQNAYTVAVGRDAGNHLVTGIRNTFVGNQAGSNTYAGTYNTAVGALALGNMIFGDYNTAVGDEAGRNCLDAQNAVFVGKASGRESQAAINTTIIGAYAAGGVNVVNDSVIIGHNAGNSHPTALSAKLIIANDKSTSKAPLVSGDFSKGFAGVNILPELVRARLHVHESDTGSTLAPKFPGLLVEGSSSAGVTLETSSTGYSALLFATPAANNAASLQYSAGSASLDMMIGSTIMLRTNLADNTYSLGQSSYRWANVYSRNIEITPPASVTPSANGSMSFQLTSDTQLTIKVKGSDGVVRSASLTLA
jgi:hypothetical protein